MGLGDPLDRFRCATIGYYGISGKVMTDANCGAIADCWDQLMMLKINNWDST